MVSIETYWNLQVIIDPFHTMTGGADPNADADLVLITHKDAEQNDDDVIGGIPNVMHILDAQSNAGLWQHVLDRPPNDPVPTWKESKLGDPRSGHEIVVTCIPLRSDDDEGQQRRESAMLIIEVDGVRIIHCGGRDHRTLTNEQLSKVGRIDVLLIPVDGNLTADGRAAVKIVRQL